MTRRQITFYGYEKDTYKQTPYICRQEPIEYFCDGKDGYIHFDGYYYVENHAPPYLERGDRPERYDTWLPQTLVMFAQLHEKDPYKTEVVDNTSIYYYKEIENFQYIIEIYKKMIICILNRLGDNIRDAFAKNSTHQVNECNAYYYNNQYHEGRTDGTVF